jgi:small GTP-binding protein
VVQRLLARLRELGVAGSDGEDLALPSRALYPEAADDIEALTLLALSRATSPLAVDLLLDQPRRRRAFTEAVTASDQARSQRLNRLITPPLVALVGAPNVGKSTLTNALHGRAVSITADLAGTTRDYTAARIDLGGLVVDWHDTPGVRASDDAIEQRAIALARRLLHRADLIIAMRDPEHDWPALADLPRPADLLVMNKVDAARRGARPEGALLVSALRGEGLELLVATVRDRLVQPADLANPRPWLFDRRLLDAARDDR